MELFSESDSVLELDEESDSDPEWIPTVLNNQKTKPQIRIRCHICQRSFCNKQALQRHYVSIHENKQGTCGLCGKSLCIRYALYGKHNCQQIKPKRKRRYLKRRVKLSMVTKKKIIKKFDKWEEDNPDLKHYSIRVKVRKYVLWNDKYKYFPREQINLEIARITNVICNKDEIKLSSWRGYSLPGQGRPRPPARKELFKNVTDEYNLQMVKYGIDLDIWDISDIFVNKARELNFVDYKKHNCYKDA